MRVQLRQYDTPFDVPLAVAVLDGADGIQVVAAGFVSGSELAARHGLVSVGDDLGSIDSAVAAWLAGYDEALSDVPVQQPGSEFQQRVWTALTEVRAGTTCSYGEVAEIVGHPGAARAVGTACATNAVAPFVPCHRVVPASGSVGQYGYGRALKEALLAREIIQIPNGS